MIRTQLKIILILIGLSTTAFGQNLVPNPDFSSYEPCPNGLGQFTCVNWISPSLGTPDYFRECTDMMENWIPWNEFGYEFPMFGDAYVGIITKINKSMNYREYVHVELQDTLEEGCYEFSMWISPGDYAAFGDRFGAWISDYAFINGLTSFIGKEPTVEITEILDHTGEWREYSWELWLPSGTKFITIGNFRLDDECSAKGGYGAYKDSLSYMFIDYVSLVPLGPPDVAIDLGDDLLLCPQDYPVVIEGNLDNADYSWSTGDTGESLEISTPGLYYVTVYDNCEYNTDSILIETIPTPILDIQADYDVCDGDTLILSLPDSLGTFEWQDGSNSAAYPITEEGSYEVTMYHACGEITKSFDVRILEEPQIEPIDDMFACWYDLPLVVGAGYLNNEYNEFFWTNGSTQDTSYFYSSGLYTLNVFNDCFTVFEEFNVEINQSLPLTIPFEDTLSCPDDYFVILTTNKGNEYLWHDGSTLDWYLAQGPGLYSVTITNSCDTNVYEFESFPYEAPSFDLGDSIMICEGDEVLLSSGLPPEQFTEKGWTMAWSTGETSDSIIVKNAGTYYLTVTGECESVEDSVHISYSGIPPEIDFASDYTICEGAFANISPESGGVLYEYSWSTGDTSPVISVNNPGWYYVTVSNSCGEHQDSVQLIISGQLPELTVPSLSEICEGELFSFDLPEDGSQVEWSDGTTGYHFETEDPGVYWVSANNNCGTVYDTLELAVIPSLAIPELGPDTSICTSESITLGVASGPYSVLWSEGSTSETITANNPGLYWVQLSNDCFATADSILIQDEGDIPFVDLGPDIFICEGDSVFLELSDNSIDSILWSSGGNMPSIWITQPGLVHVYTSNNCGETTDSILVNSYADVPDVDLGNDQGICLGDTIVLDIGNLPGTIEWSTGESGPSIIVDAPGTYSVDVISTCGTSSDEIEILDNGISPAFDLGQDVFLCPGDSIALYIDGTIGDVLWDNGSTETNIIINEEKTVTATVSNDCGIAFDTVQVFMLDGPPVIDLGADLLLCEGDSIELSINQGNGSILWNTGETTNTIMVSEPGIYSVALNTNCGSSTDSISVNWNVPAPNADLGADLFMCSGDTLELQINGNQGDILWNTGSTEESILVSNPGEYSVSITNACGLSQDTIVIQLLDEPPLVDLGTDQSLCPGDSLVLFVDIALGNLEWNTGEQTDSIIITQAGTYTATVSTSCGSNADSIEIEWLEEIPEVDLGEDLDICEGDSVQLAADLNTTVNYTWSTNEVSETIFVGEEGSYWLEISNECGIASDSIIISFIPGVPAWSLGPDTIICSGDEISITPSLINSDYNYMWNTGSSDNVIQIGDEGIYWLAIDNSCIVTSDSISISFYDPLPTPDLGPDLTICKGDSVVLDGFVGDSFEYAWNIGSSDPEIIAFEEGNYTIEVSDLCGTTADDLEISFDQSAFELDYDYEIIECENTLITLDVGQLFNTNYLWQDGSTQAVFSTDDAGIFEVSLSATCIDTSLSFIIERKYCDDERMFIPNIFSPNGDGVNDGFSIGYYAGFEILSFEIRIYDRWGNQLFQSEDPSFAWDGTMAGNSLSPGVYVYYLSLEFKGENGNIPLTRTGDITIIK
jgi:gliding motility-associated-like protein